MNRLLFQEAIDHCRWKTALSSVLVEINAEKYASNTFEEIISEVHSICSKVKGVGILTVYDMAAAICHLHNIPIHRVYIIGNGPKRAVKLLNLRTQKQNINGIRLTYVEMDDVIAGFDNSEYVLDESMRNNTDGDTLESYICNWQKTV